MYFSFLFNSLVILHLAWSYFSFPVSNKKSHHNASISPSVKHDRIEVCCKSIDFLPTTLPMILPNQCNPMQNKVSLRIFHNRPLNVTTHLMEITGYVLNKKLTQQGQMMYSHNTFGYGKMYHACQVYSAECVSKIKSIHPILFHFIYGAVCIQLTHFLWWLWENVLNLIIIIIIIIIIINIIIITIIIITIIIKSVVWIISRCSGLGNERMVRVVYLTMFLCWTNFKFSSA